jgi:hypothetical protein
MTLSIVPTILPSTAAVRDLDADAMYLEKNHATAALACLGRDGPGRTCVGRCRRGSRPCHQHAAAGVVAGATSATEERAIRAAGARTWGTAAAEDGAN